MKIPNNKLSSVKAFFLQELAAFEEAKIYFEFCCSSWLGMEKTDLLIDKDRELSESEILQFFYGIKEILNHRPIQYVVGEAWFYDLKIKVKEGVLIPRPETEELVDWILEACSDAKEVLDIGTGSGCIPLSIKNNLKQATVSAYDISEEAIGIAKSNGDALQLEVNLLLVDILNENSWPDQKFDVIVSNPPYIPQSDRELMHENVLKFEPGLALFVPNESPLLFYEKIADFGKINLRKGGSLFFEIHEDYGQQTVDMLIQKGYVNVELRKDMQGKDRMIKSNYLQHGV